MVLDNFIHKSVSSGLGSPQVEIMADTAVALASANVQLVAKKVIGRLCRVMDKTCLSPTNHLEQHVRTLDTEIFCQFKQNFQFLDDVGRHCDPRSILTHVVLQQLLRCSSTSSLSLPHRNVPCVYRIAQYEGFDSRSGYQHHSLTLHMHEAFVLGGNSTSLALVFGRILVAKILLVVRHQQSQVSCEYRFPFFVPSSL